MANLPTLSVSGDQANFAVNRAASTASPGRKPTSDWGIISMASSPDQRPAPCNLWAGFLPWRRLP